MMERRPTDTLDPIPSRANALIIVLQLIALAMCYAAAAHCSSLWALATVAVLFALVMNSVYAITHEAQHAMLFPNARVNELAGAGMALFFPAPFHLLRQGHIGHHLRNRSDDEAFDLYFDGDNVVWRWLCWLGILTGMYYVLVVISNVLAVAAPFVFDRKHFRVERYMTMDRASAAFWESFNPSYVKLIWIEGVLAIALQVAIVLGFHIPVWHYVLLYATFGFSWSAMQYVHHFDTERHVTRGARNLFLFAPVDAIWLNHNWHRAHHEHPTVPWIHLPRLGAADGQQRRGFLPWYYVKMWIGPRKTSEHVQNRYAGRIIH